MSDAWFFSPDLERQHPDRTFYEWYDSGFFIAKCSVLASTIEYFEEASSFFVQCGLELEDKDKARFKLDIYFSEFQCFEALFALLMAPFQPEPHSIYMCRYDSTRLRKTADNYLKGDIGLITSGQFQAKLELLDESVYSGFRPEEDPNSWINNLESLAWLLDRMTRKYIDAFEYNFHKHGVRVTHGGPSRFGMSLMDKDTPEVEWESEDSLRFMYLNGDDKGLTLKQMVKHFDVGESIHNLFLMEAIIECIRVTRLAKLAPGKQELVVKDFRGVDKTPIKRYWAKDFRFSIDVARKGR